MTSVEAAKQDYLDNNWSLRDKIKLFAIIGAIIFVVYMANKIHGKFMIKE